VATTIAVDSRVTTIKRERTIMVITLQEGQQAAIVLAVFPDYITVLLLQHWLDLEPRIAFW
jgi:hypothetical protein